MKKRVVAILCAGALLAGLAGCGGSSSEGETAKGGDSEEMTISIMWQQEVSEQFWDLPLEKFQEAHPDVKVEFESNAKASEVIRNLLNVQEAPDIFYSWISDVDYYGFAEEGLLYPVDDILEEQNAEGTKTLGETIFSAGLEMGKIGDSHYFLPTSKLIAGNFYSGKLFQEKGWEVPKTWEEYLALCGQIKDGGVTPMIYAGVYPFMLADAFLVPMMYNLDPQSLEAINQNEPGAWKQPAVLEVIQRLEEMRDAGYIDKNSLAMDHIQSQIDFIGNKDAFVPSGSWLEGEMEGQWPQDFQLSPMYAPGEDSEKTSSTAVVECMVLPKQEDDKKLEYIKELVQLFYSEENAQYVAENTGFMLALEEQSDEVMSALPESAQEMWEMADDNVTILSATYKVRYKEVLEELNNCINALIQEEINAEEFCERMDQTAQEIESGE